MSTITGTVKFFQDDKGFGFIAPEDGGNNVFVHISDVRDAGYDTLRKDDVVSFTKTENRGKYKATSIKVIK